MEKAGKLVKVIARKKNLVVKAMTPEIIPPDADSELSYLPAALVQVTLPHRDPGDVPLWTRTNGNLKLVMSRTAEGDDGRPVGYPYGTIPRLLLYWLTREAVVKKQRRIEFGLSLNDFMRNVGLNPITGGGKRGDAKRLREQMQRLFSTAIRFQYSTRIEGIEGSRQPFMAVADDQCLWWDPKKPSQTTLFNSWVELSEKFFEAITRSPVPLDLAVLREFKRSPLALDLYAWIHYTTWNVDRKKKERRISWEGLHIQLGSQYASVHEFRRKALSIIQKIQEIKPEYRAESVEGGLAIFRPSKQLYKPR